MKKTLAFVLAVLLMIAVAVPAFAASPTAPQETPDKTAPLPAVKDDDGNGCKLVSVFEADTLPEEAKRVFIAAQELLEEATPDGMLVKYFYYHWRNVEEIEHCAHTLDIGEFDQVMIKHFLDGKWVEHDVTINADGTITIIDLLSGPVAIFVK